MHYHTKLYALNGASFSPTSGVHTTDMLILACRNLKNKEAFEDVMT
jgi:hypothetical protein